MLAKRSYGGGSALFSVLTATLAFGSVMGSLVAAGRHRPTDGWMLMTGLASGMFLVAAALTTSLVLVIPLLALAGAAGMGFFSTANARIQLVSAGELRGRVMALYALVFLGSSPLSAPVAGWVAQHFGAQTALGGGGLLAALIVTATLLPATLARRRAAVSVDPEPEAALTAA